jgi:hypothetical protein
MPMWREADLSAPKGSKLPLRPYYVVTSKEDGRENCQWGVDIVGAGWRIRTPDLLITNYAFGLCKACQISASQCILRFVYLYSLA